jgi:hypothetical protein
MLSNKNSNQPTPQQPDTNRKGAMYRIMATCCFLMLLPLLLNLIPGFDLDNYYWWYMGFDTLVFILGLRALVALNKK